jgi:periplasmic protein TonB
MVGGQGWAARLSALVWVGWAAAAQAQFAQVPAPAVTQAPASSEAEDVRAYRLDAARHVYAAFPSRIHKGKMPPMMYAVMITEADLDAEGQVVNVRVVRPPAAAKEVTPWVVSLIRRAAPYPAPMRMAGGTAVWREIWLVDKTGTFQVDALTEGQR